MEEKKKKGRRLRIHGQAHSRPCAFPPHPLAGRTSSGVDLLAWTPGPAFAASLQESRHRETLFHVDSTHLKPDYLVSPSVLCISRHTVAPFACSFLDRLHRRSAVETLLVSRCRRPWRQSSLFLGSGSANPRVAFSNIHSFRYVRLLSSGSYYERQVSWRQDVCFSSRRPPLIPCLLPLLLPVRLLDKLVWLSCSCLHFHLAAFA